VVSPRPSFSSSPASGAAANSQARGVPERIDVNSFVGQPGPDNQNVGLQAAEIAGKAPGFIAERPLALLDTVLGKNSPLDQIGGFGPLKFLGEATGNLSSLPSAIANQSTISSLAAGTRGGWADGDHVQSKLDELANAFGGVPGSLVASIAGLSPTAISANNAQGNHVDTWGKFKADALARGFTAQDVQDYMDGKKASTDFGDKGLSSDPLTNMALKFGSDPWNLVFGAGSALKLASGAGLLARATRAGAMADRVAAPSIAAQAVGSGIAKESTWAGLAHYFGQVGRGVGAIPGGSAAVDAAAKGLSVTGKGISAYKKAAIGLTAAQLAIKGSENTPLSGFLEPLYQINNAVWDNQPLSSNMAFSLFSAFHFDAFHMAGEAGVNVKAGAQIAFGTDVRSRVLQELAKGESWGGRVSTAQVEERLGGSAVLNNLIFHTHAQAVFERFMKNPAIKAELSGYRSAQEAIAANTGLGEMIKEVVIDDMKNGRVNGRETVSRLRAWYGERAGVDASLDFPWDGRNAVDRWVEYGAAVAPVSKIFKESGNIVMGLVDQPMAMDLRHMRSAIGLKADPAGNVAVVDIRRWLNRYPQLTADKFWERFLAGDMTGTVYPYKKIVGKLRAAEKKAPTARDVFREAGDAETAAAAPELNATEGLNKPFVDGTGQVVVSRLRPQIAKRLKMDPTSVTDAMAARGAPEISAFEERVGRELAKIGLPVDSVSQSVSAGDGLTVPSVQVHMPTATLPELRLAAALAGKAGGRDAVTLAVTHGRLKELMLDPNGYETLFQLPTTDRAQVQLVSEAMTREFGGTQTMNREFGGADFTINDTTGQVSVLTKGGTSAELQAKLERVSAEISGYFPKDMLGSAGIESSVHLAYIETLSSKKGAADASYADTFREARRSGDPRAGNVLRTSVTDGAAARGHAQAGVGPDQAIRRQPGHERVTSPDRGSLAESVGLGDPAGATSDPGYLYHATQGSALESIATDGLKPHNAEYRRGSLKWTDGGTGSRVWYGETADAAHLSTARQGQTSALVRTRVDNAGHVRADRVEGAAYSGKTVSPQNLEVFAADGQWHPLDTFFTKLEPDIAQAAAEVAPVYHAAAAEVANPAGSTPTFDPTPDTLTAGLRAIEDAGPAPAPTDTAPLLSELAQMGDTLSPEQAARGQELNLQIERARAAKGHITRGQVTYMAKLDAEASREYPLHRSLSDLPAEQLADLAPFEAYLREHYPAYTLQKAPNAAIMMADEGDIAARYLRDRTWLGNVLIDQTKAGRLMDALLSPVKNSDLAKASKQALMNALMPHDATPAQVETFLRKLDDASKLHIIGGKRFFRNGQSLLPDTIDKIAVKSFSPKTIAAVGPKNFARVMDRAGNRFIRAMDAKAKAGGRSGLLARTVADSYGAYQHTVVGDATRIVGKTFYPIFRFMVDPRWWGMNVVEGDFINGFRYGAGATRFSGGNIADVSKAALAHSHGIDVSSQYGVEVGMAFMRQDAGFASRAFDAARPQTTLETLRAFGDRPVQRDLAELVRLDDVAHGVPPRAPGDLWEGDYVKAIDDALYNIDVKGAQKTVIDAANQHLGAAETQRLLPFLQKVWEANDKSYHSIVKTLGGNPDRTNLERVMNSYWLYWPISYQIKATRWLVDIMAHKMGGVQTNLAPAAMYAHYVDQHRKMLASDPSYVDIFQSNQTAWFLAQMMLPITPGDLGVSLGRPIRYAGGALGLWGAYKSASDPLTAAGAIISVGPTYTAELLARLGRETLAGTTKNMAP